MVWGVVLLPWTMGAWHGEAQPLGLGPGYFFWGAHVYPHWASVIPALLSPGLLLEH